MTASPPTPTPSPAGPSAGPGERQYGCRSCNMLKPESKFPRNGRGGRRVVCSACRGATLRIRYRAGRGSRACRVCRVRMELCYFRRIGTKAHSMTCKDCEADEAFAAAHMPPVARGEHDLKVYAKQRGVAALAALLDERGLTYADYHAMRGVARTELEEAWSAKMRIAAQAAGVTRPEWPPVAA